MPITLATTCVPAVQATLGFSSPMLWMFDVVQLLFVGAFGACIGSLTNVLVYRLPRGLDVVVPTSRCPNCSTKLTWRENIPIFGWLSLRGRCRFCWSRISPEYPIVEALAAVLFMALYWCWFMVWPSTHVLGVHIGAVRPEWARGGGFRETWPMYVVAVTMLTCVLAMALTDLKTCTVPLLLAWVATAAGLVIHPLHALVVGLTQGRLSSAAPGWVWTIPTPGEHGWWWVGLAVGGAVGVGVANGLLAMGLIGRSFADYDQWEAEAKASEQNKNAAVEAPGNSDGHPTDMWIQYPHARREMLKEIVFLAPIVGLAVFGAWIFNWAWGSPVVPAGVEAVVPTGPVVPLWLLALAGSVLGALAGGGVVWAFRVLGSLGFGKEAVGLGDVHVMAAVGACLGWIDAVLAFFLSAFVGLAWEMVSRVAMGEKRRAMPFVPCLAMATLLVVFGKPLIEAGLGAVLGRSVGVNLP